MIDMHMHSKCSDGEYSPEELVDKVYRAGIKIFSLTDHDTAAGTEAAAAAAKKYKELVFISGMELSTEHKGRSIHVLGYGADTGSEDLAGFIEEQREKRRQQKFVTLDYLKKRGVFLSLEEVEEKSGGETVGRPHFALAMVERGYVSTVKEAFDKYLAGPEYKKIQLPRAGTAEAVSQIRGAGGIAVIAHPGQIKAEREWLEKELKDFISAGLQGIECHYGKHTGEETAYYLSLAEKYDLIHTGGSDFHGEKVKPDVKLGTGKDNMLYFTDYEYILESFRKVLKN